MNKKLNKKIFILDCDFFYQTSRIPNYKAMKLSSFHKQKGDYVVFITEEYQITNSFDILYLIRELRHTPFPSGNLIDDRRTRLIGKEFSLYEDQYIIPNEVAVVRPDYTLYEEDSTNIYTRANYVQFFNNNVVLKHTQDWHRAHASATVVVDNCLWDAPSDVVIQCLNQLTSETAIMFLEPIKLRKLLDEKVLNVFLKLKLAKSTKMRYNNNVGEDFESITKIIDVIKQIKTRYSYINVSSIPVRIITKDHWLDKENIWYDFERCLKIMSYAQTQKIRINFKYPKLRLASPSWFYFEFFKTWSNHYHTLSYVEALTSTAVRFYGKSYVTILNNDKYWLTGKITQVVHLLSRYPDLMKQYAFTGWGGIVSTSSDLIDFDYVKEKAVENNIF